MIMVVMVLVLYSGCASGGGNSLIGGVSVGGGRVEFR